MGLVLETASGSGPLGNFAWLARGDKLPAVAVAQLLLNRTGQSLKVDGDFGPRTKAAVEAFQRDHSTTPGATGPLPVNGEIAQKTWVRLANTEPLQIIDCIDVFDPDLYTSEYAHLTGFGASPITVGGMSNGIEAAVNEVVSRANNLFLLRFHGHGAPGRAGASMGQGNVGDHRSSFRDDAPTRAALARLATCFGPYGCIQFMHCSVANGQAGARFLQMVANTVRVPASAAVQLQYAGNPRETMRYEGPTRTFCPPGQSLSSWGRSRPAFAGMSIA